MKPSLLLLFIIIIIITSCSSDIDTLGDKIQGKWQRTDNIIPQQPHVYKQNSLTETLEFTCAASEGTMSIASTLTGVDLSDSSILIGTNGASFTYKINEDSDPKQIQFLYILNTAWGKYYYLDGTSFVTPVPNFLGVLYYKDDQIRFLMYVDIPPEDVEQADFKNYNRLVN